MHKTLLSMWRMPIVVMTNITSPSFFFFLCAIFLWSDLPLLWAAGGKHRKTSRRTFDLQGKTEPRSEEGNHFSKMILAKGVEVPITECLFLMTSKGTEKLDGKRPFLIDLVV